MPTGDERQTLRRTDDTVAAALAVGGGAGGVVLSPQVLIASHSLTRLGLSPVRVPVPLPALSRLVWRARTKKPSDATLGVITLTPFSSNKAKGTGALASLGATSRSVPRSRRSFARSRRSFGRTLASFTGPLRNGAREGAKGGGTLATGGGTLAKGPGTYA
jgi:hypothetical protein